MQKSSVKIRKTFAINLAVSVCAVAILVFLSGADKLLEAAARVNWFLFALAVPCYVAINVAMAYRIKAILGRLGEKVSLKNALGADFAGMLASDFTPARSGYVATAFVLNANRRVKLDKAIVSILGPQLFDFILKVVAGCAMLVFAAGALGVGEGAMRAALAGVAVLFLMVLVGALMLFSEKFVRMLSFVNRLPFGKGVYALLVGMRKNSFAVIELLPLIAGIIAITWTLKAAEWWLIGSSVGINVSEWMHPLLFFALLQPFVTLFQFVPTPTLAGMGISEAGAVGVLVLFGVGAPQALLFALLTRFIMIMVDLVGLFEIAKAGDRFFEFVQKRAVV